MSTVSLRRGGNGRLSLPRLVFNVRSASLLTDLALAIARAVLAWIFIYYGAAKLFSAFNGPGIHATTLYFANVAGLHPGSVWAWLNAIVEFGGGIAMALGFFTRLAALGLFVDMVMAMVTVTWATGINSTTHPPGYQLNIAIAGLALVIALLGAGRFSLDGLIDRKLASRSTNRAP